MNKFVLKFFVVFASILLSSCSDSDNSLTSGANVHEEIEGEVSVYDSMARATKYNVDDLTKFMSEKVDNSKFQYLKTDQVIEAATSGGEEGKPQIFSALRKLDFAVVFADATLAKHNKTSMNFMYDKSAQSLALVAIKYHEKMMFSQKNLQNVEKSIEEINKKISILTDENLKKGELSLSNQDYKKSLETILIKYENFKNVLLQDKSEYLKLIKVSESEKIKLEGKKFYEIQDFDERLKIDVFQKGAVSNREEFYDIYSSQNKYSFASVEMVSVEKYPDSRLLILNGYGLGDKVYQEALQKRAEKIAYNLVRDTQDFKFTLSKRDPQKVVLELNDNLVIAIFTQIELAYNVINLSDLAISDLELQIKRNKTVLTKIQKDKVNNINDIKIYEKKLELLEDNYQISKHKGERAAAIRALYFYSGFDPFTKELLSKPVAEISEILKSTFTSDVSLALSQEVNGSVGQIPSSEDKGWAKRDGWLMEVVDGEGSSGDLSSQATTPLMDLSKLKNKSLAPQGSYYNASHNDRTTMQLGAYTDVENAHAQWNRIHDLFPEIVNHKMEIEQVSSGERILNRLVVISPKGGLVELCNDIKKAGMACILR